MNPNQATIALPSKGRLKEHVLNFLKGKGYSVVPPEGRQLQTCFEGKKNYQIFFLHPKDIATMLDEGIIDIGFTGLDLIAETAAQVRPVVRLGCSQVKTCLLVPQSSLWYHPCHLLDKMIATPFPNIAKSYFDKLKIRTQIRPISGTSEIIPSLGIVDAIVDIVETGQSAQDNGLKVIVDDIFDSECVCAVKKPEFQANYRLVHQFLREIYE